MDPIKGVIYRIKRSVLEVKIDFTFKFLKLYQIYHFR